MPAMRTIRVAIVGCGTVGGATARLMLQNRESIARRSGVDVELAAIVDLDFTRARAMGLPDELLTDDLDGVLADASIEVIVELVGGLTFARTLIETALDADRHVVTANKALLAHHGNELFARARGRGLAIGFEASCGGGIPIIRALTDGLLANTVDAIYGIVNGTSNFILTEMIQKGRTYREALATAQQIGLAEADPTLDVEGIDSAHKITIMTALAFGTDVVLEDVPVAGINNLDARDVAFGHDLGYVVKLLAVAHRIDGGVTAWVRPAFIPEDHPLAWVNGPFNAVSVYGNATGHTLYYGRGAGGDPTASAVISDVIALAHGNTQRTFAGTGYWPDLNHNAPLIPVDQSSSRYYVRIMAQDRSGVLAEIAGIMGRREISIASLRQNEQAESEELIPVVITTHTCREADLRAAIEEIDGLASTGSAAVWLPIVDEHEEFV